MKINEVEKLTGLSKKAIRLYEAKGLISVQRVANGYRDYSEEDVRLLGKIKLYRMAGISVSDIKLLGDNVISAAELIEKRKKEIEREYGKNSEQYRFCDAINTGSINSIAELEGTLEETEEPYSERAPLGETVIGIDIGTTTISASVIDITNARQVEVFNVPNCFSVDTVENGFDLMDADGIFGRVQGLIDHIISDYPNVRAIGIDGQMHGILYLNAEGRAISSLVTWRDKRCDRLTEHSEATVGAESYCERISRMTGERIATGYGLATHYYNCQNGLVPEGCAGFCSIMDYAVMRLTDTHEPLLHASVAASLGFYDVASGRFKADKLRRLFGDDLKLPKVTKKLEGRGKYRGIPVCVAIGDNQASFLGSVGDHEKSVLVNIGTGSQISMASSDTVEAEGVEIRPLLEESCLVCGSALCGGSAYAMLERFFSAYAEQLGARELSQYSVMNSLALSAYEKRKAAVTNGGVSRGITVRTEFAGTRAEPERRGGIDGIDMGNFTPENLTLGFIEGICRELLGLFENVDMSDRCSIVASGGAVQRIDVMKSVIADVFGMEVSVSSVKEEASVGAALAAAYSAGLMKDERDIQMLAGKLAIRR